MSDSSTGLRELRRAPFVTVVETPGFRDLDHPSYLCR